MRPMTDGTDAVRVLVVDDEPAIARAVTIALRRAGFGAEGVQSGEAAIQRLKAEKFDCMIVDLRMPDMRGDAFFELAAAIHPHLRRQTLFTTGDITERADRLIEACKCPMLRKPFDLHEVIATVRTLVQHRQDVSA